MTDHIAVGRLWRHGAVAAAIATAVNLLVLALGRTTGGTFVVVFGSEPPMPVGVSAVTVMTVVSIALGLALTPLVARAPPRRLRTMQFIGAAVAVASLFQPLTVEADTTTRIALAAMHLITGAAFVLALWRTRPLAEVPPAPSEPRADAHRHA